MSGCATDALYGCILVNVSSGHVERVHYSPLSYLVGIIQNVFELDVILRIPIRTPIRVERVACSWRQ